MSIPGDILIIDDEATLRQTLARIFKHEGYGVTSAASGHEGLTLLSQHTFDLVFLDIRMPDMNGMEVLKAIHGAFPDIPVVLFTAQPDVNSAVEALRQGAIDYLLKPLKPRDLIDRTQVILAQKEKERRKHQIKVQIDALEAELRSLENDQTSLFPLALTTIDHDDGRYLTRGGLTLDLLIRSLKINEQTVVLPPATFDYLLVLVRHAPNLVDYQTLVAEAQGYQVEFREAQSLVKWHVHQIRKVIEPDGEKSKQHLVNVRHMGYRLVID